MQRKIDRAIEVCSEMMNDRGYVLKSQENEDIIKLLYEKSEENSVLVFLLFKDKLNIAFARTFLEIARKRNISHLIIIYNDEFKNSITSKTKDCLENLNNTSVEFFSISSLQYNITKHVLVPKHILATKEEVQEIQCKYVKKDLPIILKTDPICKYYNFKPSSIIKIIRKKDINFRVVK